MRIVGLISGGKDSIFNMLQCIAAGHEIVAVANVEPNYQTDEMDSYMYQTVGHQALSLVSAALSLPIYRQKTKAHAICKEKFYVVTPDDEVEDLYALISKVKEDMHIEGVSVGAIASDYQRTRVESVCSRLNLKCFAYLWRRDQQELLSEMIASELEVIVIKVAALGLKPEVHLGATITDLQSTLIKLNEKFGINVCGEGGEYETLTLDCPLYHRRIKILDSKKVTHSDDAFAPVGYLSITNAALENKMWDDEDTVPSLQARLDYIRKIVNPPLYYVQDCLTDNSDNKHGRTSRVFEALPTSSKAPLGQEESIIGYLDMWKSRQSLQQSRSQSSPSYTLTFSPSLVVGVDTAVVQLNHSTGWCCIGNITAPDIKEGLNILRKHLERCHYEFRDLVAVNLYIRDMNDWPRINKVYSSIMPSHCPPTRVCTAVPLGNDMGVILTAVAHRLVSRTQKIIHHTLHTVDRDYVNVQSISHWAPACIGPYSQCIRIGEIVYVAGQIPLVPGSMEILVSSVYDQCRLTLRHVQRILQAMNESYTLSNVMFGICFVSSEEIAADIMSLWNSITKNEHAPIAVVVAQSLPKFAQLEWQVLACGYERPRVNHTIEKIADDFEVVYKRCVYVDHNTASLVCNISYTRKTRKRDKDGGMLTPVHILTLMKQCLQRLRGDITGSGTPLCIFTVFFKATEQAVVQVINETMKGCLDFKVVISSIPVIGFNQQDIFLTITGVCH